MKIITVPLTAMLSVLATNFYWFGGVSRQQQARNDVSRAEPAPAEKPSEVPPPPQQDEATPPAALAAAQEQVAEALKTAQENAEYIRNLEAQLRDLKDRKEEVKIPEPTSRSDPFQDLATSLTELQALSTDLMQFAFDSCKSFLWPWPTEAAAKDGTASTPLFPIALEKVLLAKESIQTTMATVREALPEQVQATLASTLESAAVQVSKMGELLRQSIDKARDSLTLYIERFLQSFPQHRELLTGRDPIILVLCFALMLVVIVHELYVLVTISCALLAMAIGCCCCCCLRRGSKKDVGSKEKAEVAAASEEPTQAATKPAETASKKKKKPAVA